VAWRRLQQAFVKSRARGKSKTRSLERWALRFMHRPSQLNYLAGAIVRYLADRGHQVCVRLESTWIDGTPQAKFISSGGKNVSCELGDLLVVVDRFELTVGVLRPLDSRALIVQAKLADDALRMPGGRSTTKERDLLETALVWLGLELHAGTSSGRRIGQYFLPGLFGLRRFATYLLVPRRRAWRNSYPVPYVCAWPTSRGSRHMIEQREYVATLQALCDTPVFGEALSRPGTCDWTDMVHDLLNTYGHVRMAGYGRQLRVTKSAVHCATAHAPAASGGHHGTEPPHLRDAGQSSGFTTSGPSAELTRALQSRHGSLKFVGNNGDGTGDRAAELFPDDHGEGPGICVLRAEVVIRRVIPED
jgi:hypothetical protein